MYNFSKINPTKYSEYLFFMKPRENIMTNGSLAPSI